MYYFGNRGNIFWKKIELHRQEAIDMREWSQLVLRTSNNIVIIGY